MKLFLVKRTDDTTYDEYISHLIRADSKKEAREKASLKHGGEGALIWLKKTTKCIIINSKGKKGIIISDYHAG